MDDNEQKRKRKLRRIFACVALGVLVTWLITPFVIGYWYQSVTNAGAFADTFGSINALFSGLAFAVLIYTLLLQSQELEYQREQLKVQNEELKQTRVQIEGQKEQLAAQNQTLRLQAIESAFFSQLNLLNGIINSIEASAQGETKRGREAIKLIYDVDYRACYRSALDNYSGTEERITRVAYDLFVQRRQSDVGHYHRTFYRIIKFVKLSALDDETKRVYAGLLRAQLSSYQIALLFYNCLGEVGEHLKPYVEDFALLKNWQPDLLMKAAHKALYAPSAFGE
jgi:hypothetical protein